MRKTYVKTVLACKEAVDRLESLKASLGQEATDKLQAEYEAVGGEQFVENTENVKCRFHCMVDRSVP